MEGLFRNLKRSVGSLVSDDRKRDGYLQNGEEVPIYEAIMGAFVIRGRRAIMDESDYRQERKAS